MKHLLADKKIQIGLIVFSIIAIALMMEPSRRILLMQPALEDTATPIKKRTGKDGFDLYLPFRKYADKPMQNGWEEGEVDGRHAWRDTRTGLVWTHALEKARVTNVDAKTVHRADAACAKLPPKGSWALPQAWELDDAKEKRLHVIDPTLRQRWLTYQYDDEKKIFAHTRLWRSGATRDTRITCIGMTPPEPKQ
ncbi:MAG: hypothetical protein OXT65_05010 [Alphaproteobacteria bacterium]|nr:hypothetical protein [Alphaproteobacteria bacterium]